MATLVVQLEITKKTLTKPNPKPRNRRWVKKFKKKYEIEVADTDHFYGIGYNTGLFTDFPNVT